MELDEYREPLAYELAFWMQGLTDPEYPLGELGSLSLAISAKFRVMAIMVLLVNADSDRFYHNLIRSGIARETYLKRLKNEGVDKAHHLASGRYQPLLDVIAAGDFGLARNIVELLPTEWQKGHEYEDDYCYAQILHRLVQETPPEEEFAPLLEQFEVYLDGEESARLHVCRALVGRNQEAFDEAFEMLLNEQDAKIAADRERGQMEDPEIVAQRQVFVEGLAILRLAERRGLTTQAEYQYCPSLARVPIRTPFPGE
jgi:Immunity protein 49